MKPLVSISECGLVHTAKAEGNDCERASRHNHSKAARASELKRVANT